MNNEESQDSCCGGHCQKDNDQNAKVTNNEAMQKENSTKDTKITELTNDLKRLQAEFENFRKRNEKANEEYKQFAKKNIIIDMLNIADNFTLALKNTKDHDQFVKGVEMIYRQTLSLLEQEGIKQIEAKKYDANLHEALLFEKSDKEDYTILEELQKGYTLHGKVIKHAKVKIAKNN